MLLELPSYPLSDLLLGFLDVQVLLVGGVQRPLGQEPLDTFGASIVLREIVELW